jgi:hypothetical protein
MYVAYRVRPTTDSDLSINFLSMFAWVEQVKHAECAKSSIVFGAYLGAER